MRVPKSVKSLKKKEKKAQTLICCVYVPQSLKIFPKPNFARLFRSMTYSIMPNIFSIGFTRVSLARGQNSPFSSANRRWPLQLLYYRTTVITNFTLFSRCCAFWIVHLLNLLYTSYALCYQIVKARVLCVYCTGYQIQKDRDQDHLGRAGQGRVG